MPSFFRMDASAIRTGSVGSDRGAGAEAMEFWHLMSDLDEETKVCVWGYRLCVCMRGADVGQMVSVVIVCVPLRTGVYTRWYAIRKRTTPPHARAHPTDKH